MRRFSVGGKTVSVFLSEEPGAPVLYLNTFGDEGERVFAAARADGCPPFTLAAVSGLAWEREMAPWDSPPAFRGTAPFAGGADDYLRLLTQEILPAVEGQLPARCRWRGIAGYSLAGLFALYALCKTDAFCRAASVSGSLWVPGFKEYLFAHAPKRRPDCLYFSLGDRESKTRSPLLRGVQRDTEEIRAFYQATGIDTAFVLNPGGHHDQPAARTAAGIGWLLRR